MFLCLACSQEFPDDDPRISDSSHKNYGGCPGCGHNGIPADTSTRLSISITWHELRVLCIWAERWASMSETQAEKSGDRPLIMLKVVYGIADRIQAQHLEQETGLTFRSELAELSAAGLRYEQNVIKEEPNV
ncbi:MAG: hypothetical protein KGL39_16995 [Patescibacteria group bacterium]|nr:hypothetical protein [Patescibacteria group bacterium]